MITKQLETKIVENQDVEAVQLMTRLASFCVIHEHCESCPFYNKLDAWGWNDGGYECSLTRTDRFTPADWEIKVLVN